MYLNKQFLVTNQNFTFYVPNSKKTPLHFTSNYIKNTTTAVIQSQVLKNQFIPIFELILGVATYIVLFLINFKTFFFFKYFSYYLIKKNILDNYCNDNNW